MFRAKFVLLPPLVHLYLPLLPRSLWGSMSVRHTPAPFSITLNAFRGLKLLRLLLRLLLLLLRLLLPLLLLPPTRFEGVPKRRRCFWGWMRWICEPLLYFPLPFLIFPFSYSKVTQIF